MDSNQPTACTSCRKIVTDKVDETGKPLAVWVCEHCGTENETPSRDAVDVQKELDAAVSQVSPPQPAPVIAPAAVAPPPVTPAVPPVPVPPAIKTPTV